MLHQKRPDGHDAGEGVQAAEEEGVAFARAEGLHFTSSAQRWSDGGGCWRSGGGHQETPYTLDSAKEGAQVPPSIFRRCLLSVKIRSISCAISGRAVRFRSLSSLLLPPLSSCFWSENF